MLENIETKLNNCKHTFKRFKCAIVVRQTASSFEEKDQTKRLLSSVKNHFPGDYSFIAEDCVITVVSSDEILSDGYQFPRIEEFNQILEKYDAHAIVSNSAQWNNSLAIMINQCYEVLPIAVAIRYGTEKDRRVLKYHRYSYYYTLYLAEQSMGKNLGTEDVLYLCDPAVLTVTRFDRSFNSELRDVLFTYLMQSCNLAETSRKLFMHRNTIAYKLEQIRNLIGTDWVKNPYARHNMLCSCMIMRYVEEYHKQYVELPEIEKNMLKRNMQ